MEAIPLFFDFESFYTQDYSLRKMSPPEYILNPLFEAICLGVASFNTDPMLIDGPDIPTFLDKLKARRKADGMPIVAVSHNAQFDMSVMAWRFDFHPDLIIDTIAMSRTVMGPHLQQPLARLHHPLLRPAREGLDGQRREGHDACRHHRQRPVGS